MPYVDPSQEAADGQPFSENEPARADAFNLLLRQVARERSGVVTLIDLNKLLDPNGSFTPTIDGVTVRDSDGIHISIPGGEWLRSSILPTIAELGCSTVATTSDHPGALQAAPSTLSPDGCIS
jgi:hypothetical protein